MTGVQTCALPICPAASDAGAAPPVPRPCFPGDKALVFFEEFHVVLVSFDTILCAIIGIHFQALNVSSLEKYLGIILLFIMATTVYIIAYLEIKLQRQDAAYLFIFRLVCLVSGILSVELPIKCVQLLIISLLLSFS